MSSAFGLTKPFNLSPSAPMPVVTLSSGATRGFSFCQFVNKVGLYHLCMYTRKLLGPTVSAAIALIVVTNFCIVRILGNHGTMAGDLVSGVWPIALTSTIAVILVMSSLYHALQELVTELELRQQRANEEAQRDPLTSLANRRVFEERLQQAIVRYKRDGERFSVLMLDLDNFKRINDLLGHQAGDELLKMAAGRLQRLVRQTDTVARFGGDEFLILQSSVATTGTVRRLCTRISLQLGAIYKLTGREVRLPASVGAVVATDQLDEASDYIRAADMALYAAKAAGRNCYRFFTHELDAEARRRDELETDLRKALHTGSGVSVHFQPQLDVHGEVVGVESLLRWTHPNLGLIPASEAIAIAEDCGLISRVSELVFRQAARFARAHPRLSVAVNLSPLQFEREGSLCKDLLTLAIEEGVSPHQLELEITEQLFMRLDTGCEHQMEQLRNAGFRLSLDDFGTGYSSLSYLGRFKVDRLKLDRTFVAATAEENITLIRAAVTFAHSIGLEVVAEGIESPLHHSIAFEAGCDTVQGNYYARPMATDELDRFLAVQCRAAA